MDTLTIQFTEEGQAWAGTFNGMLISEYCYQDANGNWIELPENIKKTIDFLNDLSTQP